MSDKLNTTSSSLDIKDIKLNLLLEITEAINDNYKREELFKIYEDVLKNKLKIGKLALFSDDDGWRCALKYGVKDKDFKIDLEKDLLPISEITEVNIKSKPHFEPFDVIIPVFHKSKPLAYLLIGDIDEGKIEVSPTIKHLPFIQTLTNIIVVAIENKKLAKEQIKQEGIRKELELASEMQTMLFPTSLPNDDKLQIAAYYQPHHQIGGDYYDYIKLNEEEVVFCLADVSGKGISAAFLMSNLQANIRASIKRIPIFYLVQKLNSKVMTSAKGEKFITLFIAKYNLTTRVLNYINAGHHPPFLLSPSANSGDRSDYTVSLLEKGCTGLGIFDELPEVNEGIITIPKNSILICYTDGVVELENEKGEEFGTEALKELILKNRDLSMQELNDVIIEKLAKYKGNQPYIDDIALFSCRFF